MIRFAGFVALASLVTVLACGDDNTGVADDDDGDDSPSADGGRKDGGAKDSGAKDAGKDSGKDAGRDAGPRSDASTPGEDAGEDEDASVEADAGVPDGGGADDDGGGLPDGGGEEPDAGPVSTAVQINEVLADPPLTDDNKEFVELRCNPGLALDPYWFVIVDGDVIDNQPNAVGVVKFKKKLTGITCGATGLVVLQRGGVYDGVVGTTYVDEFFTNNIENGSQTYLLVESATLAATDIDADNDGVIDDATVLASTVDSVAVLDGTAGDRAYSTAILSGVEVDAISRFAGRSARSASSWYFGEVAGPPYAYALPNVSASFPAGGTLSPGLANTAAP